MLHTETVAGSTLELLKKLEAENAMSDFNLAGGTSLALYLGHRISVDKEPCGLYQQTFNLLFYNSVFSSSYKSTGPRCQYLVLSVDSFS